jgi:hypothetical protein
MGRKRRRSRAFPADEDGQPEATLDEDQSAQARDSTNSQADEEELTEERKKELAVWEAFKEEHHEGSF